MRHLRYVAACAIRAAAAQHPLPLLLLKGLNHLRRNVVLKLPRVLVTILPPTRSRFINSHESLPGVRVFLKQQPFCCKT